MAVCEHSKAKGKGGRAVALVLLTALSALGHGVAYADSCTTSLTTISGAVTDACDLSSNESLTVESSGAISVGMVDAAVYVGSAVTGTTITNYGRIDGGQGIVNFGSIDTITNYGTITGASYSIRNGSTINVISNSGILDGKVELQGATLNINGASGRVTGAVTDWTDSSVVNVNGAFSTENTFSVWAFNIVSDAVLNMAHDITATVGVNNHGTLAVADGITANILGGYTQDGVLSIGASSATSYGMLSVSGDVTLSDTASFYVNVAATNTLAAGNVLSGVLKSTTGTLTNNGSALAVADSSNLFNFTATQNGNQIDITTVAAGSSGGGSSTGSTSTGSTSTDSTSTDSTSYTVLSDVRSQGFTPGLGAARVLDGFVQGGAILTGTKEKLDFNNIVTALGTLATEKQVSDAVAQTLPLFTAGLNQTALNTLHGTTRIVQARQEGNLGASSGDEFLGDRKFWLKPVGSWTRQDNRKGVAGYSANTYGFVIGADGDINDNNRIGVAFSYMNSNVDGKSTSSGNSASINAYQAIVYGSRSLTVIPETELNWQADIGLNKNKGHRSIDFGGLNRVAKSDYDSTTAHIGAGIARNYQLNDKTTITPVLRADYTWIRDESYTETGAVGLNLNVNSHSVDELILMAEGRIARKLNDRATLVANTGIGYDVLDGKNSVTASYVGGGAAFHTQGMDVSPWLGRAGLGLAVNATETTEITARYDLEARSDFTDQTASVKVRWMF